MLVFLLTSLFFSFVSTQSWSTGHIYDFAKSENLMRGKNQQWFSFKHSLIEHYSCSTTRSAGQEHFKAKQFEIREKRLLGRNTQINFNLMSAAITVCKTKAAALQYETMVGLLSLCEADVGDLCHGRYVSGINHCIHFNFYVQNIWQ